ncbi:MAG: GtrA family protein [Alphaproteobacteria bacterium]
MPPLVKRLVTPQVLRYLAVGGVGFLVDAGGMEGFIFLGFDNVHLARLMSMLLAIASTYLLHRYFTFKGAAPPKSAGSQFTAFGAIQIAAAILNYAIFSRVLYALPDPVGMIGRLFALSLGVAAGLCFNYLLLQKVVFRAKAAAASTTAASPEPPPVQQPLDSSPRTIKRGLLWMLIAVIMINSTRGHHQDVLRIPNLTREMLPADPDVWMRLAQVRDWVTGGGFFDHIVHKTDAPYHDVATPWTRPMDALLALFYKLMPQTLSVDVKLMLAGTWLPPLLGFITCVLLAKAAAKHFNWLHTAGITAVILLFNALTYSYYSPGDSDHHGLLTTLWCGAMLVLVTPLTRASGAMLGVILGTMIWISPEGLMLMALAFAVLGAEALRRPRNMPPLVYAAIASAVTVTGALFVEMPASEILKTPIYDSVSIVHATLLWLAAGSAMLLSFFFAKGVTLRARLLLSGLIAAAALLGMFGLYPKFFRGPLVDVDPYIMHTFLPSITETMPLFEGEWTDLVNELTPVLLAMALLAVLWLRGHRAAKRRRTAIVIALLAGTFIMTCWQIRWGYYMQPVAVLAIVMGLPAVMGAARPPYLRWTRALPRNWRSYLALWVVFMVSIGIVKIKSYEPHENAYCMSQIRYVIHTGQLQRLIGDKPTTLFVHQDSGGDVIFFTPYSVIAGNYHREGRGMQSMYDIAYAKTPDTARKLMEEREVGAMLICSTRFEANSWIRQAYDAGDKYPRWMTPVKGMRFMDMPGPKPQLFKVKK